MLVSGREGKLRSILVSCRNLVVASSAQHSYIGCLIIRYDTYTPTKNIVFHDYGEQENGHGNDEWFKRQRDRFRKAAIDRVKTILQIPGGETSEQAQANLGIYGLGKRRSLVQFQEFLNMDFKALKGNAPGPDLRCSGASWVPYDDTISPVDNLFDDPDDLDPQPEFPLRTELTYYQQVEEALPDLDVDIGGSLSGGDVSGEQNHADAFPAHEHSVLPPFAIIFVFWIFGLIAWCAFFLGSSGSSTGGASRKNINEDAKDK